MACQQHFGSFMGGISYPQSSWSSVGQGVIWINIFMMPLLHPLFVMHPSLHPITDWSLPTSLLLRCTLRLTRGKPSNTDGLSAKCGKKGDWNPGWGGGSNVYSGFPVWWTRLEDREWFDREWIQASSLQTKIVNILLNGVQHLILQPHNQIQYPWLGMLLMFSLNPVTAKNQGWKLSSVPTVVARLNKDLPWGEMTSNPGRIHKPTEQCSHMLSEGFTNTFIIQVRWYLVIMWAHTSSNRLFLTVENPSCQ